MECEQRCDSKVGRVPAWKRSSGERKQAAVDHCLEHGRYFERYSRRLDIRTVKRLMCELKNASRECRIWISARRKAYSILRRSRRLQSSCFAPGQELPKQLLKSGRSAGRLAKIVCSVIKKTVQNVFLRPRRFALCVNLNLIQIRRVITRVCSPSDGCT